MTQSSPFPFKRTLRSHAISQCAAIQPLVQYLKNVVQCNMGRKGQAGPYCIKLYIHNIHTWVVLLRMLHIISQNMPIVKSPKRSATNTRMPLVIKSSGKLLVHRGGQLCCKNGDESSYVSALFCTVDIWPSEGARPKHIGTLAMRLLLLCTSVR